MRRHIALTVGLLPTNCYIVYTEGGTQCAVIDPGDNGPRILETLRSHELEATYIFVTHGHFDHIMGIPYLRAHTGAKTVIHEADAGALTDSRKALHPAKKQFQGEPAEILVKDGDIIEMDGLQFTWLHTPGHTAGSCCILCEDALYSGDTLFYEECGRCDLPGGSYPQMLKSLARLAGLSGNPLVFPGHDRSSSLDHERERNQYMREALGS